MHESTAPITPSNHTNGNVLRIPAYFSFREIPCSITAMIGILIIAVILQGISRKEKYAGIRSTLPFVWLLGVIGAVLSCISGFLLSQTDDYDQKIAGWHQWLAITTT